MPWRQWLGLRGPKPGSSPVGQDGAAGPAVESAATAALRELLEAYSEALRLTVRLPLLVRFRAGSSPLLRWIPVFRPSPFLRTMAAFHISRSIGELKRYSSRQAALAPDPGGAEGDMVMLERFERSLPPIRVRTLLLIFLVLSFFAAWVEARVFHADPQGQLLTDLLEPLSELKVGEAFDAFNRPKHASITEFERVGGAALLLVYAAWLGLLIPAQVFRLKRVLFGAATREIGALRTSDAHSVADGSIYALERKAFETVHGRRPFEGQIDLIWHLLLVLPLLPLAVAVSVLSVQGEGAVFPFALFCDVVAIGTLAYVAITWRQRLHDRCLPADARGLRRWTSDVSGVVPLGAVFLNFLFIQALTSG